MVCIRPFHVADRDREPAGLCFAENAREAAALVASQRMGIRERKALEREVRLMFAHEVRAYQGTYADRPAEFLFARDIHAATALLEPVGAHCVVAPAHAFNALVPMPLRELVDHAREIWGRNTHQGSEFDRRFPIIASRIRRRGVEAALARKRLRWTRTHNTMIATAICLAMVDDQFGPKPRTLGTSNTHIKWTARARNAAAKLRTDMLELHGQSVPSKVIDRMLAAGAGHSLEPYSEAIRAALRDLERAYGEEDCSWGELRALWERGPAGLEHARMEGALGRTDPRE